MPDDPRFLRGWRFQEHVVGIPFNRDTQFPCEFFQPCKYGKGKGTCEGDGHYMCNECIEFEAQPAPESDGDDR